MGRKKPLAQKKPMARASMKMEHPVVPVCPQCKYLEQQYDDTIGHIRDVLGDRFQTLREKLQELHSWQGNRDEAIEAFYAHKRTHRMQAQKTRGRNVA